MAVLRLWIVVVVGGGLLLGAGGGSLAVQAQPDSVRAEILEAKGFPPDHSPRGALWRAAVVPGWGQFYNRQYYKIPFVYAGLAGLGFLIYRSNEQYVLFRRAHLFGIGRQRAGEGEENEYQQYREQYEQVEELVGGRLQELRDQRDQFRRRRDLAILGTGVFYALTLLDAYVSAQLLTFDVGEDLALTVQPTGPVALRGGGDPTRRRAPTLRPFLDGPLGMRIRMQF